MKILKTINFFSFINLICNSVIYLNFSSFNSNNLTTKKEIISKILDTNMNTEICIGSPKQCQNFLIDINFYPFFIVSKDAKDIRNISNKFDRNLSKTYSFLDSNESKHFYSPYFQYGVESSDLIHVTSIENEEILMNETNFLLVNELASYENVLKKYEHFSGMIGLGVFDYNEYTCCFRVNLGFIFSLKKGKIVENNNFFFKFDKNNDEVGKLFFGEKPHNLFPDEYKFERYVEKHASNYFITIHWVIEVDNVYFGFGKFVNFTYCLFDVQNGMILADGYFKEIVDDKFFGEEFKKGNCQFEIIDDYIYYYCNKKANLKNFYDVKFYSHDYNYTFVFTKDDLFYTYENTKYFLIYFPNSKESKSNNWILGKVFLKKYLFVFNSDSKTIGFYKEENNLNKIKNKNSILLVILICISIVLLISLNYIIIFCLKKERKKKAFELNEEYVYQLAENIKSN